MPKFDENDQFHDEFENFNVNDLKRELEMHLENIENETFRSRSQMPKIDNFTNSS